jgi:iron complex transport system permease protein
MTGRTQPLTLARVVLHAGVALAVAILFALLIPLVGGNISLREALTTGPSHMHDNPAALIFWGTRMPRVLIGLLVGGSLAIAGLVFQSVLRNPLAEPYILGISGGAALGKALAVILALRGLTLFFALTPLMCFAGALAPLMLLYVISTRTRRFSTVTILLGGVMMNVFFSSLILLLQYFANFTQVRQMFLWMMGGLDVVGYGELRVVAPLTLAMFAVILTQTRAMNLLSLGPDAAAHLGVDVRRSVNILIWTSSILTSAVVAVSGPIGFVGLLVPHSLRLIFGADNRLLAPLCMIWGGVFLIACDFLGWRGMELLQAAGLPIAETSEIPVGVITALLGGPFFLWLLLSRRQGMARE